MYFNKEQFSKCLDCIESSMYDYLECTISLQPSIKEEDKEDLLDVTNILNAVKTLRKINFEDYNDESDK